MFIRMVLKAMALGSSPNAGKSFLLVPASH